MCHTPCLCTHPIGHVHLVQRGGVTARGQRAATENVGRGMGASAQSLSTPEFGTLGLGIRNQGLTLGYDASIADST